MPIEIESDISEIEVTPSGELSKIVGKKPITYTSLTKKLWKYIKKNNLQGKKDKTTIKVDKNLKAILKGKGKNKKDIGMFDLPKAVHKHVASELISLAKEALAGKDIKVFLHKMGLLLNDSKPSRKSIEGIKRSWYTKNGAEKIDPKHIIETVKDNFPEASYDKNVIWHPDFEIHFSGPGIKTGREIRLDIL